MPKEKAAAAPKIVEGAPLPATVDDKDDKARRKRKRSCFDGYGKYLRADILASIDEGVGSTAEATQAIETIQKAMLRTLVDKAAYLCNAKGTHTLGVKELVYAGQVGNFGMTLWKRLETRGLEACKTYRENGATAAAKK